MGLDGMYTAGGASSTQATAVDGCSGGHSIAMFVMGFGSGMLFLLVTGGVGPSGGLTCVAVLREKAVVAAAAFKLRVEKNVVFYACVAQVTANTCFGVGSVIGKMGLPNVNPVLFALCREVGASVLLVGAAWRLYGLHVPSRSDGSLKLAVICGAAVVLGQFLFLVGLKLSSAVTASVWQPSQPIFTLMLAITLGREKGTMRKAVGMGLAFLGCFFMVEEGASGGGSGSVPAWVPNLLFFGNCLGTPVYVLTAKTLTAKYPSLWVTAWAYVIAAGMLVVITLIINSTPALLRLMCPPPDEECGNGWDLPTDALWALLYWIFFVSAVAYALITWGNQHLESSVTSSFFALQPVAAAIVSFAVVASTAPPHHGLSGPGVQHLGAIGVLGGLYLIVSGPRPKPPTSSLGDSLLAASPVDLDVEVEA